MLKLYPNIEARLNRYVTYIMPAHFTLRTVVRRELSPLSVCVCVCVSVSVRVCTAGLLVV